MIINQIINYLNKCRFVIEDYGCWSISDILFTLFVFGIVVIVVLTVKVLVIGLFKFKEKNEK